VNLIAGDQREECENEISFRNKEVSDGEAANGAAKAAKAVCESDLATAQNDL